MEVKRKRIKLLGAAGRKFVREIDLAVKSPAEAVRALCANFPEFKAWVLEQHDKGVAWRVVSGGHNVPQDHLRMENDDDLIVLAPVLIGKAGGGSGSTWLGIIVGAALIAFAFVAIPIGLLAAGTGIATGIGFIGAGLVLNGISTLLTPTPKLDPIAGVEGARSKDLQSNLFSRNQSTSGQGEAVPLVYGNRLVRAPRVVSFDLGLLPSTREIDRTKANGLLGYVDGETL